MACEFSWLIGEVVGSSLTCGLLSWSLQPYDFLIPGNAVTEHGTLGRSVMSIHQNHLMDPLQPALRPPVTFFLQGIWHQVTLLRESHREKPM